MITTVSSHNGERKTKTLTTRREKPKLSRQERKTKTLTIVSEKPCLIKAKYYPYNNIIIIIIERERERNAFRREKKSNTDTRFIVITLRTEQQETHSIGLPNITGTKNNFNHVSIKEKLLTVSCIHGGQDN